MLWLVALPQPGFFPHLECPFADRAWVRGLLWGLEQDQCVALLKEGTDTLPCKASPLPAPRVIRLTAPQPCVLVQSLCPFYRSGSQGTKRFSDLFRTTQPERGRSGVWSWGD